MNKNNGLLMGIAGLIIVAAGIIIIVILTNNPAPETVPETVPVVAVTPPVVDPITEEPVVEPVPVVTSPVVVPVIKTPVKQPVVVVTGSAPEVTTLGTSSLSSGGVVLNGLLTTHNVETYFSFKYGTTPSSGMETRVTPIAGSLNPSDVTLAVFNLMPHTIYYYQLHAHNQYGITSDGINQFTTAQ